MKDAIGQEITEGWAIQCDARRGSSRINKVYVVGTVGKSVEVLGEYTWATPNINTTLDMLEARRNGDEVPTYKKVPSRIVMLREQEENK